MSDTSITNTDTFQDILARAHEECATRQGAIQQVMAEIGAKYDGKVKDLLMEELAGIALNHLLSAYQNLLNSDITNSGSETSGERLVESGQTGKVTLVPNLPRLGRRGARNRAKNTIFQITYIVKSGEQKALGFWTRSDVDYLLGRATASRKSFEAQESFFGALKALLPEDNSKISDIATVEQIQDLAIQTGFSQPSED